MSGPRPLLLLAVLCTALGRASAQEDGQSLAGKARALQSMTGAPGILYIGDSHTAGTFGREIDAMLRSGYPTRRVETYGECGASALWYLPGNEVSGHTSDCGTWFHRYNPKDPSKLESLTAPAPTPLLPKLLASRPETVIVALGANMANWKKGGLYGVGLAKDIADAVGDAGARCIWIGPPDEAGFLTEARAREQNKRLNERLKETLGDSCVYIPSRTKYDRSWPDAEKLHYPPDAAEAWAIQVFTDLRRILGPGGYPASGTSDSAP